MAHLSLVLYRPRPEAGAALLDLVRSHVPQLRERGLANDFEPLILRAKDGTLLELFEWSTPEAIEAAHIDPAVQAMWGEFAALCDFARLADLAEAGDLFAHFERLSP